MPLKFSPPEFLPGIRNGTIPDIVSKSELMLEGFFIESPLPPSSSSQFIPTIGNTKVTPRCDPGEGFVSGGPLAMELSAP